MTTEDIFFENREKHLKRKVHRLRRIGQAKGQNLHTKQSVIYLLFCELNIPNFGQEKWSVKEILFAKMVETGGVRFAKPHGHKLSF